MLRWKLCFDRMQPTEVKQPSLFGLLHCLCFACFAAKSTEQGRPCSPKYNTRKSGFALCIADAKNHTKKFIAHFDGFPAVIWTSESGASWRGNIKFSATCVYHFASLQQCRLPRLSLLRLVCGFGRAIYSNENSTWRDLHQSRSGCGHYQSFDQYGWNKPNTGAFTRTFTP